MDKITAVGLQIIQVHGIDTAGRIYRDPTRLADRCAVYRTDALIRGAHVRWITQRFTRCPVGLGSRSTLCGR